MVYKEYIGKQAIKNEISTYLYKQFVQWYFKRNVENLNESALQFNNRNKGAATMRIVFPENPDSNCQTASCNLVYANNISIYIGADTIDVRFYENGDAGCFKFDRPICELIFQYMNAYDELNLIQYHNKIPTISNKQAMNKWLKQNLVDPIQNICDYLVLKKKIPYDYEYTADKAELIVYCAKQYFKNSANAYITRTYIDGVINPSPFTK